MELNLLHLFIISIALILITKRYLQIHFSKPLALPILGHLHLLQSPIHQSLTKLSQNHGHVLHLLFGSRPVLLISSPSATKQCFTNNDTIFANRPLMLAGKHFGYNHTAVVFSPYNQRWRELRRFMALHALSPSRFPSFSSDLHSLILKLYSGAGEGCKYFKKVEVRDILFELMMNVISGLIAEKKYNGEGCGVPEEGRKFRKVVEEAFLLSGASTMADFIPVVRWMGIGGAEKRMKKVGKELDEFYQKIIEDRRRVGRWKEYADGGDQEKKSNIIDVMLAMQEKDKDNYSDVAIKGVMTSMLAAGTETTAGTMEWTMALLLNHPNALKKAKAEIKEQVGHNHLINDSDISKLHYLNNVIKETLRLFPAGPLLVPHESSEDCTVSGVHIPKGTMLLVNIYAMQRGNQLWDNPLEFKPERFDSDELVHGDEGYKYIPFGIGRRRCPGESLAWKVMLLTLGALIQCFEWERVGKELVDLSEGTGITIPMAKPLQAMYKPCIDMHAVLSQL
ncbi:cytochrome P450 81Q32-like isoform X1 [Dioscorea cayenensis subsp. rotundata]|uniref:Cytochrome P450 81Q32-like isoform X1 n=1 Tax=Dioscorea cayennensis subsp. rotundata TaxID=55577 RepID=A0AB40CR14_DIOCR|nr:cytochrome P450 81Q32-like isoform X1 [Dioscorea cayenensis subsp. rotundata]